MEHHRDGGIAGSPDTQSTSVATIGEFGSNRLTALGRYLGFGDEQLEAMERQLRQLLGSYSKRSTADPPAWLSDVSDDHSPFEFSVAIDGSTPELRLLVESRGNPPTLESNERWGMAVNERLHNDFGICLDRFEQIRDLFFPANPQCVFAIWHAVCFWPGRRPEFKCYLNLAARGPAGSSSIAREALERLGFGRAWPLIAHTAMRRGADLDRLMYFSLDLSSSAAPRVKLYLRHFSASSLDLEIACTAARDHEPGRITEFCRTLTGGDGPFTQKGPVTCLSFVTGDEERPSTSTLYFPIAAYAPNDRVARNRIASYLVLHELPLEAYTGPLETFATRRLDAGVGLQSYAALRWSGDRPRVTVYLSPEIYGVQAPRPVLTAVERSGPTSTSTP
jgi:DMATS type aromatic prenyltransferase